MNHYVHKANKHPQLLTIGSSIALNNLYSPYLTNSINKKFDYYNLSSWNFSCYDIAKTTSFITGYIKPKVVIWLDNQTFYKPSEELINKEIPNSLELMLFSSGIIKEYSYLKNLDYDRLLKRKALLKDHEDQILTKKSLHFDEWGGTYFSEENDSSISANELLNETFSLHQVAYEKLEFICDELSKNNIKMIYINFPYGNPSKTKKSIERIFEHAQKTKQIVLKHHHIFIDGYSFKQISSNMFFDSIHLYEEGAKAFTKELTESLNIDSLLQSAKD
jgi:hypothetical protein